MLKQYRECECAALTVVLPMQVLHLAQRARHGQVGITPWINSKPNIVYRVKRGGFVVCTLNESLEFLGLLLEILVRGIQSI